MATFTKNIIDTLDDGHWEVFRGSPYGFSYIYPRFGTGSMADWFYHAWYRFTDVSIPQGATINSAKLSLYCTEDWSKSLYMDIYCVAADSGLSPTTSANGEALSLTSSSVPWSITSDWYEGTVYDTPDLKIIVQEIVDRSGWASGNAMVFIIRTTADSSLNDQAEVMDYQESTTDCSLLTIEYETTGGGDIVEINIPLISIPMNLNMVNLFSGTDIMVPMINMNVPVIAPNVENLLEYTIPTISITHNLPVPNLLIGDFFESISQMNLSVGIDKLLYYKNNCNFGLDITRYGYADIFIGLNYILYGLINTSMGLIRQRLGSISTKFGIILDSLGKLNIHLGMITDSIGKILTELGLAQEINSYIETEIGLINSKLGQLDAEVGLDIQTLSLLNIIVGLIEDGITYGKMLTSLGINSDQTASIENSFGIDKSLFGQMSTQLGFDNINSSLLKINFGILNEHLFELITELGIAKEELGELNAQIGFSTESLAYFTLIISLLDEIRTGKILFEAGLNKEVIGKITGSFGLKHILFSLLKSNIGVAEKVTLGRLLLSIWIAGASLDVPEIYIKGSIRQTHIQGKLIKNTYIKGLN